MTAPTSAPPEEASPPARAAGTAPPAWLTGVDGRSFYKKLRRLVAATFLVDVSSVVLSVALSAVLARTLGAAEYGVYAYALALVGGIGIPARFGLARLIVRELAAYRARSEWDRIRGLLRWANATVLIGSLALATAAAIVAWVFAGRTPAMVAFTLALPLLPFGALSQLRAAALRGFHFVVLGKLPEAVVRPVVLLVLASGAALTLTPGSIRAGSVITMEVVATVAAFVVGAALLKTRLPREAFVGPATYTTRPWVRSVLPLAMITGVQFINHRVDILMLGAFRDAADVGVYQVAARSADCVHFVLVSVNAVMGPTIASLYASRHMERLQGLVTVSARMVLLCSLPFGIAFIVAGRWILVTLFGPEFGAGAPALAILSAGQLVNAAAGSVGLLLTLTGHERYTVRGVGAAAVVNVILGFLLIPVWGGVGAALATTTSLVTWNVLLAIWVYRRLGIRATALGALPFRRRGR
jgi:O-antigen/teichoic acid export membrane protein